MAEHSRPTRAASFSAASTPSTSKQTTLEAFTTPKKQQPSSAASDHQNTNTTHNKDNKDNDSTKKRKHDRVAIHIPSHEYTDPPKPSTCRKNPSKHSGSTSGKGGAKNWLPMVPITDLQSLLLGGTANSSAALDEMREKGLEKPALFFVRVSGCDGFEQQHPHANSNPVSALLDNHQAGGVKRKAHTKPKQQADSNKASKEGSDNE
eukprot:c1756_g1_i1.p1 GENE.c1756_g1_i1~~c1756_g1_i1.p1  ORF type:complete len:206 (+),score=58.01 c1756_g1_i1:61-678(+)